MSDPESAAKQAADKILRGGALGIGWSPGQVEEIVSGGQAQAGEIELLRAQVVRADACLNAAIRLGRGGALPDDTSVEVWAETVKRGMAMVAGAPEPEDSSLVDQLRAQVEALTADNAVLLDALHKAIEMIWEDVDSNYFEHTVETGEAGRKAHAQRIAAVRAEIQTSILNPADGEHPGSAILADNAALLDALRECHRVLTHYAEKHSCDWAFTELDKTNDLLTKEHPGEAMAREHAEELAERKAEYDRLGLSYCALEALYQTACDIIKDERPKAQALREALGDRGRAECPKCLGTGMKFSEGLGLRTVECPCRKEWA